MQAEPDEPPHPWTDAEEPLGLVRTLLLLPCIPLLLALLPVRLLLLLILSLTSKLCCAIGGRSLPFVELSHAVIGRCLMITCGVWPGLFEVNGCIDPAAPVLVIAPHMGLLDICVMMAAARCPRPVGFKVHAHNPLVGHIFRAVNGIAVSKPRAEVDAVSPVKVVPEPTAATGTAGTGKGSSANAAVRQAILDHKASFKPNSGERPIGLLPEGTTANGRSLLRFFSGAFAGGSPVQPVVVTYPHRYFNAACFLRSLPEHLLRQLVQPWQRVRVDFLPMCVPSEEEARDPSLFAENVRKVMAAAAKLPLSDRDAKQLYAEYRSKQKTVAL